MAVSQGDDKAVTQRMGSLLNSGTVSAEPSTGAVSTASAGATIGALPVYTIDAPSTTGTSHDGPLGDLLGDAGDDLKDGAPVDRKVCRTHA